MTATIEILLHVPAEIASGIAEGTLVRRGGIVWEKASGQVRAHLREGEASLQFAEQTPPPDSIRELLHLRTNDSADRPLFNQLNEQLKIIAHRLHEQEIILMKIIENLDLVRGFQQAMFIGVIPLLWNWPDAVRKTKTAR